MNGRFYNIVVSVFVTLFLISVSSYQSEAASSSPPDKNTPQKLKSTGPVPHIKFDNVVHDFGDISPDSYNNCTFAFTNAGKATLQITRTKGTCKCTVPELQKKDYAPGESGQVSVRFHAPRYSGPTSQRIFVSCNDPENPRVELTIRARVQTQVRVAPETMTLSLVDANNAGAVAITLKSIDNNEPFAVTAVHSEGGVFTIDFDPNKVSDTHTLYPKVNVENLRKYLGGYIIFTINHPANKSVRVGYNCLREFDASPTVIIIRDAVAGEVQKRTIYLTSNYNQPIELESIVSDKGIIKVVNQVQTANRFKIDVDIIPPPREGKLRIFSDTLHIKIKGKGSIDVPCRGFYKVGQ